MRRMGSSLPKRASMKTLDELKAENAEAEADTVESPQEEAEETEAEEVEAKPESEQVAEPDQGEGEVETEAWMESDGDAEKTFSSQDVAAVRKKWKGRLREKDEENEQLKAEIERLKYGKPEPKVKPTREDFAEEPDPDGAYFEALSEWKLEQKTSEQTARQAAQERQATEQRNVEEINAQVDQHYVRAIQLEEKSGITPERFKSADFQVRKAIDTIFPKSGDTITDTLIASLGDGSEKVFFHLGVNKPKLDKLGELLTEDRTGMKAAMYLGSLKTELTVPNKRTTSAPKPAPEVEGDQRGGGVKAATLKKRYTEADKRGDVQARFDARREAKAAGVDVSDW